MVEAISPTKNRLTLQISCTRKSASCPLCQQSSERIHGRYSRTVADVLCGGRLVTLALTIRKFVCSTKSCPRRIFTERLPDLVQSYARMRPPHNIHHVVGRSKLAKVSRPVHNRAGFELAALVKRTPRTNFHERQRTNADQTAPGSGDPNAEEQTPLTERQRTSRRLY